MDIKKPQSTATSPASPAGGEKKETQKKKKGISFQLDSAMLISIAKIIGVVVLYFAVKGAIDFTEYIPQVKNSLLTDLVQRVVNIYVDLIFVGIMVTVVAGFIGKKIELNLIQIATYIATGVAAIVMISFILDPATNGWWTVVVTAILTAVISGFAQNKVPAHGKKPYLLYAIGAAGLVVICWQLWVLKLGAWFSAGASMFGGAWVFGLLLASTIFVVYFFFIKK